jgi:hypothetical protein
MLCSGPEVRATGASELPEMYADHGLRAEAKDGLMAQASPVRTSCVNGIVGHIQNRGASRVFTPRGAPPIS